MSRSKDKLLRFKSALHKIENILYRRSIDGLYKSYGRYFV